MEKPNLFFTSVFKSVILRNYIDIPVTSQVTKCKNSHASMSRSRTNMLTMATLTR